MNISAPFIARPIATWLLAVAILLAGALGYRALPVSALPEVDFPTIQVTTQLPGASPETVATLITASLERQFGQIPGLITMTSQSSEGTSQITLQFALNRSMDSAAQDVQAAINAAAGTLPANLPYPPVYAKVNPADAPILTLALTSDSLPIDVVSDAADTLLQPKLSEIDGVGRVTVQGGLRPAVRVRVDPARLASYGLAMEDVRTAVANANVNGAKGGFDGPRLAFALGANDQLVDAAAYQNLVIAWRNGAPVRLADVGSVIKGVENDRVAAWYKDQPAAVLDIQRQPGANIVQTVQLVKAALPRLQNAIPSGIQLTIVTDRTETIRASVLRRADHADHVGGPGGGGDLPVPALAARHLHPGSRPASVAGRNLRRHAATRLRARQPVADGTDHRDRLRGRRCDRDDREHRALHRAGHAPAGRRLSRRGADRLHHRVADRVADRGVHPAAVHGRRGGTTVPGVRRHPVGRRGDLGNRLADADADDVQPHPARRRRRTSRTHRPCQRSRLQRAARRLSAQPGLDIRSPDAGAAGRRRHAGGHDTALHRGAEGFPAAAGHRGPGRRHRGGAERLHPSPGRIADAGRADRRARPRGDRRGVLRRRRHHQRHAQHRAADHRAEADQPA